MSNAAAATTTNHEEDHHHQHPHHHPNPQSAGTVLPQPAASLLTCSFNQDGGCLAIGTTSGFSVHNLHPHYAVSVQRELQGGIGHVEMLFRCNLMALVGGGPSPQAPPHRVVRTVLYRTVLYLPFVFFYIVLL